MTIKYFKNGLSRLLIVVLISVTGQSIAVEREFSVSGAVYYGVEPDLGLSDLWLATLSKQSTLKVLDRANIRTILGELSLTGVGEDSARQVRLGGLLGVEYFAWLKVYDDQVLLEIVEATTGRGLAIISRSVAKGQFPEILPELAGQAVHVIDRPPITPLRGAPAIAFSNPFFSTTNAANQVAVDQIIAGLSKSFLNSGITVLPRRFVADTIQERWRQEKGLAVEVAGKQKFLGADYVLNVAIDTTNSVEITMVEVATGRRMGKKEMPSLDEARVADGMKELNQWVMGRLTPILEQVTVLPKASTNNAYYAAPEILKSLYAGMVLHNQGRYLDALPLFKEAQSCKMFVIDETEDWIDSCYRLAGFPEIADEVSPITASYKSRGATLNAQSLPGVILLGVTAGEGIPRGMSERMGMLLVDRLHEASGGPVLASEDISGLRDEYDVLLGLDKVKGTTWRKAPPILVQNAVTAHLESENAGIRLRLCLIRNSNPTSIYDVVTSLPDNHALWSPLIDKATKKLFTCSEVGSIKWSPPQYEVLEDQQQLLAQLKKSFTPWIYLKVILRNPELKIIPREKFLDGWTAVGENWRLGLERWALRVLPEGHPDRPMLEFSVATFPIARMAIILPDMHQKLRVEFQKLADKYPAHLVGLYSRYNLLLIDMTSSNIAVTQARINLLISDLKSLENNQNKHIFAKIRKMESILRYALRLPCGILGDPFSEGGIIAVKYFNKWDDVIVSDWDTGANLPYSSSQNNLRQLKNPVEQVLVDLEALCFLHNQEAKGSDWTDIIPARFFKNIIEKYGSDSALARYTVLRYFWLINKQSPADELQVVCPVFAESVCGQIEQDSSLINSFRLECLMQSVRWWPQTPVFANACQKIKQTIQNVTSNTSYEVCRRSFAESWKVGPLKDTRWLNLCEEISGRDSDAALIEHYAPYLTRLHELYDGEVKSPAICRLYSQFGTAFFKAGRYDLAEPLFEQLVSLRDDKNRPPCDKVYAQSLFLLAFLKQRNGDSPAALRLAKEAVDYMDGHPDVLFRLLYYRDLKEGNGPGPIGFLKPRVMAFIKDVRENPRMEFKNPFK